MALDSYVNPAFQGVDGHECSFAFEHGCAMNTDEKHLLTLRAAAPAARPVREDFTMISARKPYWVFLLPLVLLAMLFLAPTAFAQDNQLKFNPQNYTSLVDATSPDTIPVGTKITAQNWQQYRRFMPVGLQALYGGKYPWKFGPDQDYTVEVGPTTTIPMPKKFSTDSEKYSGQARLKLIDSGGYTIENYQAGLPFPNPSEPQLGYKVVYNNWYYWRPFVYTYLSTLYRVDRNMSVYKTTGGVNNWRVSHLSDDDMPMQMPYAGPYFLLIRNPQFTPEQNRYITTLQMLYSDPAQPQDSYNFLPTLRRSLRLSTASRCAPLTGSDWVYDDNGGGMYFQVPYFNIKVFGKKKILALVHEKQCTRSDKKDCFTIGGSVPGWPKPELGPWEVINAYVLDITPLPKLGRYCYPHKIAYVATTNAWVLVWWEVYDENGNFWKIDKASYRPVPIGNGEETTINGIVDASVLDVQDHHASVSLNTDVRVDSQVDTELQNAKIWGFPGGLDRVLR